MNEVVPVSFTRNTAGSGGLSGAWIAILVALTTAGAAIGWFALPDSQKPLRVMDSRLGLKLLRDGAQLRLQWEPGAGALQAATQAQLLIEDGSYRNDLLLSSSQIQGGSVLYAPHTSDVAFQMTTKLAGGGIASESLRVIDAPDNTEGSDPSASGVPTRPDPESAMSARRPGEVIFGAAPPSTGRLQSARTSVRRARRRIQPLP